VRLCSYDHPSSAQKLEGFASSSVENAQPALIQTKQTIAAIDLDLLDALLAAPECPFSTHCGRSVKLDSACSTEHSDGSTKRGDSECLSL
jgi:hypothetical protein